MLRFLLSFFILLLGFAQASFSQYKFPEPFLDNSSGLYGYQSPDGRVKIKSLFSAAYPFSKLGYAKVDINGREGVINKKGKYVIEPIYEKVGWSEDTVKLFAENLIGVKMNGNWGVNDLKGNEILSPRFEKIAPFMNGNAVVAKKEDDYLLFGLINQNGKIMLPLAFQFLQQDIVSKYLVAKKIDDSGEVYGIITNTGQEKIPFIYKEIKLVAPGCFAIKNASDKWGIYNEEPELTYTHSLDSVGKIRNGQFVVKKDNHYAAMDASGKLTLPFQYKTLSFRGNDFEGEQFKSWQLRYPDGEDAIKVFYDSVRNMAKNIYVGYAARIPYLFNNSGKVLLTGQFDQVTPLTENFLLVQELGLFGMADTVGNMVIPISYASINAINKDFLLVTHPTKAKDIFNYQGDNLTKGAYAEIEQQENDWFKVTLPDGSKQFLDKQLKTISPKWDFAGDVKNELVAVKTKGLFGVTDFNDNWRISPFIDSLHLVNEHYMLFYDNGSRGSVNYSGVELFKTIEASLFPYGQNCTLLKKGKKWGMLNTYGTEILPPVYDSISIPTEDSIVYVFNKGKKFYMDLRYQIQPKGNEFDKLEYDPKHSEGYFRAKVYGLWGFVDYLGRIRVYCQYDDVHYFSEGLAGFKLGGKWGFLNTRGKIVIQPVFEEINTFSGGKAIVKRDGKWGLINKTGAPIVSFDFDEINITKFGNYKVRQNNKYGIFRKEDLLSIYPKFDAVQDLGNGTAIVRQADRFGVSQLDGITIAYPEFNQIHYNVLDNSFFLNGGTSAKD